MREVQREFSVVEEILGSFSSSLGDDLPGYRNHVGRVLNFFTTLVGADPVPETLLVAAAFHDLGIWTHGTFDYLEPSERLAADYLSSRGANSLTAEVRAVIHEHHKIRPYTGAFAGTVEAFRKADLVDVSLGVLRFGLPAAFIRSVQQAFPDRGFHWRLVTLSAKQFARSPLRPFPMMHW